MAFLHLPIVDTGNRSIAKRMEWDNLPVHNARWNAYRKEMKHRKLIWRHNYVFLLTPRSRVLLEKLTVAHLVKKFSTFYGIYRFIIVFTRSSHWSPSWHPTCLKSILLSCCHPCLGLPSGLFASSFSTKILCASLNSSFALWTHCSSKVNLFASYKLMSHGVTKS
jgi:hypothetical protein